MKNISILEGLRGWLAIWVMISHIMLFSALAADDQKSHYLKNILSVLSDGRSAVWIFMILSGFVNFYLLDVKREGSLVYITRRFLRLYPLYITLFAASLFINQFHLYSLTHISWAANPWIANQYKVTTEAYDHLTGNLLTHVVMLHGLVPSTAWPDATSAFLGVDWSISTEWQFYLLAPLLFWVAQKRGGLAWLGIVAILCAWSLSNHSLKRWFENGNPSLLVFKFQFFYIGMISYFLYQQLISLKIPGDWPAFKYFIIGLIAIYLTFQEPILLLWAAIFCLLVLHHHFPGDTWLKRSAFLFTNSWAQYFGRISYSIYLFHWVSLMIVLRLLLVFAPDISAQNARWIMFPTVILLTFLGGHVLYHHLEKPFIDYGKRMFKKTAI